jgi:hypothetical protein
MSQGSHFGICVGKRGTCEVLSPCTWGILCHLPQYSLSLTTIFSATSHFYIHLPVMDARVSKTALTCDSQRGFNLRQDTKAVYPSVLKSMKDSWFLVTKS